MPDTEPFSTIKHLKGKYEWNNGENKAADNVTAKTTIDTYGWADGKKRVSIHVDVDDDVPDDAIELSSTAESVTFTVQGKTLHIPKLAHEITEANFARKPGKNQTVVKLTKRDEISWHKLVGEIINKDSGCYTKEDVKSRVT